MAAITSNSDLAVYGKVKTIIGKLYTCTAKEQIDTLFEQAHITDPQEKITLLRECMEVESVYGTPETITAEDEYDFECAVFVEGTWRMLN